MSIQPEAITLPVVPRLGARTTFQSILAAQASNHSAIKPTLGSELPVPQRWRCITAPKLRGVETQLLSPTTLQG